MGLLIFVAAGTASYWQGWVYLAIFFTASALTTRDLMKRDPALLARRMSGGPTAEQRPVQKIIMAGAALSFIAPPVVPALMYRFHGATMPARVSIVGNVPGAIGFSPIFPGLPADNFTSAAIEGPR